MRNRMLQKKMLLVLMAAVLMSARDARATAILTMGNDPQTDENVLWKMALDGNPIFGTTNQTATAVRVTSDENLTAPANGQARIDAVDGVFTSLIIDVPNGSFTSLIFNPDATIDGTVDFTATTNTGIEVFNNIAVSGNGQNFFTFTTLHGQRFSSIAFQADGPLTFADAAQFRIGGAQVATVPDAASTLWLLGSCFVGIAVARRRLAGS
jgi:hypothetical protein